MSLSVSPRLALPALLLCLALLQIPTTVNADKFTVGGSKGWNPNVNYTEWAMDKRFHVGDWLVFLYQPGQVDVLQVNETAFNQCLSDSPITNYSKGRSFAFELNKTGKYYFICSRGYCYGGMKLAIKVEKIPPPPPPEKMKSAAAYLSGAAALVRAAAAVAAAVLASI
ncbi:early nodulin-like protein 17 [Wolffia australiana]